MRKQHRIVSTLLACCLLITPVTVVNAAETSLVGDQDVTVTGTIYPKADAGDGGISVVVPTRATFIIDGERNFISPDYVITNNSVAKDIKVTAKSLKAIPTNSTKVTAQDAHTDEEWKALSHSDTVSQIALGLVVNENVNWFAAEDTLDSNISLGTALHAGGDVTTKFNGKYGWNWDNAENLIIEYNMTLSLDVAN